MRHDTLNEVSLPSLYASFAKTGLIGRLLDLARDEDLGVGGDVTSRACGDSSHLSARVVARQACVVSGLAAMDDLRARFAPGTNVTRLVRDGNAVGAGLVVAAVEGPGCEVVALERTFLNLLGRLSGIATLTAEFVRQIPGESVAGLYDTRKTTPGLRVLEKYAVRCGGGKCHRLGLHDAVLIKDNHLAGVEVADLAGFVRAASERAKAADSPAFIEVEVDTHEQLAALLTLPAGVIDIVLLDNMDVVALRAACRMRDHANPSLELEASGGVRIDTVRDIASTGVNRISVGALTHQAVSIDFGLDV